LVVGVIEGPGRYDRLDNVWIPLGEGIRLAARIWVPEGAAAAPVPAILEYTPYRKNDVYGVNDQGRFGYLAAHGYAGVRLDIRGSGDSEGILYDEYLKSEQDDAVEAIGWIAAQPWCNGAVGMIGKSWGGFNGLQVAALRPPALKAVVTVYSTDDRYATDAHWIGGCLKTPAMLGWGTTMHTVATGPPDPNSVGEAWKQIWRERLEAFHPQIHTWLTHQRRDAYWKHGSVCENFADITCAIYAVGGWADAYRDPVFRLLEGLSCPKKALIGPWPHQWAMEAADPGPQIGFLQEVMHFFDHWLKGIDNGVMEEPMLRVWLQDPVRPARHHRERPGRWAAEPSWPSPNISARHYYFNDGDLSATAGDERPFPILGAQSAGADSQPVGSGGTSAAAGPDQRGEDGQSLSFTSAPLESPVEILGNPVATLELSSDRPWAIVVVRLCDVAEDGMSLLLARGLLNLTHRHSHELPEPLVPDERVTVRVALEALGQMVPSGHRLRVAVSPTYWPLAWPSPEPVTLTVFTGKSSIELPVRSSSALDGNLRPFGPPEVGPKIETETLKEVAPEHLVTTDQQSGRVRILHRSPEAVQLNPAARLRLPDGLEVEASSSALHEITEGDPLSARSRMEQTVGFSRGDFDTSLTARSELTADATTFHFAASIRALEGGEGFFERDWSFDVPREFM
jgi:putative CocE/NonD family hydrolase